MANNILTKLFGNYSKRELKRIQPQVDRVLALEETYRGMDDETLKAETPRFRKLLEEGKPLDDILPEVNSNESALVNHPQRTYNK